MKIKYSNNLFKLFVVDPLPPSTAASYESDLDVPRVIVDSQSLEEVNKIRIEKGAQNTVLLPFSPSSEEDFNNLGIEAIILAHSIFKHESRSLGSAKLLFDMDVKKGGWDVGPINAVLMSEQEGTHNVKLVKDFCSDYGIKLQMWPQIKSGEVYALPDPEFFGVIPIRTASPQDEEYAIGIINTKPIMKVMLS